jgi:alpha-galactosidase/6-phospho-beta-glucosidase family protein
MKPSVNKILTKLTKDKELEKVELSLGRELDKLIAEGKELSKKRRKLGEDANSDATKIENLVKSFNNTYYSSGKDIEKRGNELLNDIGIRLEKFMRQADELGFNWKNHPVYKEATRLLTELRSAETIGAKIEMIYNFK